MHEGYGSPSEVYVFTALAAMYNCILLAFSPIVYGKGNIHTAYCYPCPVRFQTVHAQSHYAHFEGNGTLQKE